MVLKKLILIITVLLNGKSVPNHRFQVQLMISEYSYQILTKCRRELFDGKLPEQFPLPDLQISQIT